MRAHWIRCRPNNYRTARVNHLRLEFVVIHIMEGTLAGNDNWFANAMAKVSAHEAK